MEEEQINIGSTSKFRTFIRECWRVLLVTKKPDKFEFKTIVKVSALGIAIIGLVGFLIHIIRQLIIYFSG